MDEDANIRVHLERAAALARKNSTVRSFQTGAVLVKRHGPRRHSQISWGEGWSHSSTLRLTRYRSIHAELHALMRSHAQAGCDIFVATIRGKSGNTGLAKPCEFCQELLFDVGIRRAYFTVEGSEFSFLDIGK